MTKTIQRTIRIAAVAALGLGAAVNANAWILNYGGTNVGTAISLGWENGTLLGPSYTIAQSGITSGTVTFANGSGDSLDLAFTGTSVTTGGVESIDGTWSLVSESGVSVGKTGTFSGSFDNLFTSGNYEYSFVGTTTPEPTSMAAVGIGLVGILCRRKRK